MRPGDQCWKDWGERLRMRLMRRKQTEITLPIQQVFEEVGYGGSFEDMKSYGFWNPCRNKVKGWDTLFKQEIEVDFETNEFGKVELVTFRLEASRIDLMEGR